MDVRRPWNERRYFTAELQVRGTGVDPAEERILKVSTILKAAGFLIAWAVAGPAMATPWVVSGSAAAPWIEQKFVPEDGMPLAATGWSVAVHGDVAMVGAYYQTINGNQFQGAVYVFAKTNGAWTQVQELTADDGADGDNFVTALEFDGSTALIGELGVSIQTQLLIGAVYVFTESGGVWTQSQKLMASDGAAVATFGITVGIQGSNALIGASGAAIAGNNDQGAVYAFTESGGTWTEGQKITANDGVAYDQFGQQLAFQGTTAVIGADQATYANQYPGPGAAYVFDLADGTWTQTQRLEADDGVDADYFGRWAAIDGSTIVIGAPAAGGFQGAAYVFVNARGSWAQSQKLVSDDGIPGDFFADAVAISGTTLLIGAPGATLNNNPFTGAAYLYNEVGSSWTQGTKLTPSDGQYGDEFGFSVALEGNSTALIGAPHPTDDGLNLPGAAYFYSNDAIFADGFDTVTP